MKKILIVITSFLLINYINANEIELDGETVQLQSLDSGYCIKLEQNNDKEGTKLIQAPCGDSELEELTFTKNNDYYVITLNNGKALSVAAQSESNGINIVQNTTPTLFKIISKDIGFALQAKHSRKYISTTSYNTDIEQAGKANKANQLWSIYTKNDEYYGTCKEILDAGKSIGDGIYTIDPDGVGYDEPFEVYCDMTNNGGGWTRIVGDLGGLTMNNDYINQFMSNPDDNKIAQWIKNSDGSYEAPTNDCYDYAMLNIKTSIFTKSSELRVNAFGEAGNQYTNTCTGWGSLHLRNSNKSNYYYILDNSWGKYQAYGKNVTLTQANNNLIYTDYSSGVQIIQLQNNLTLDIGYKGTPRHIFDISIR